MWLKILNQSWSFVAKLSSQPRWVPLLLGSITLFLIPSIYSCLLPSGMVSSGRWRVIFSFPDCMLLQILSSSLNLLITHLPPLNWLGDALSDELHSHHSFFFFFICHMMVHVHFLSMDSVLSFLSLQGWTLWKEPVAGPLNLCQSMPKAPVYEYILHPLILPLYCLCIPSALPS